MSRTAKNIGLSTKHDETKMKRHGSAHQTLDCPLCGKAAKRFASSFYCEECNIDFDEDKQIVY